MPSFPAVQFPPSSIHFVSCIITPLAPICSFWSLLILSHAEGDHRTFNKVPLKYTEKSCVLFFYQINIAAVCAAYSRMKTSSIATTHKTFVKEFFARPKAVWEENRHDSETREGRTEPDGLLWRGTAVNRRHCSLFGCLLAENGQKSSFTDDLRWDSIMIV